MYRIKMVILFWGTIFLSERNSGRSCQYMDAVGKLALHRNLRVHFESEYLNPEQKSVLILNSKA